MGSFKKVADKVKLQVEAKYDPSMYEDALKPVNSVAGRVPLSRTPSKIERISRSSCPIDIPLGDDDEALELLDGRSAKPRRGAKNQKPDTALATDGVAPLSMKEAAALAGVQLAEPESAKPEVKKPSGKSVTVSAEISDPPKIKRIDRAEVEAEAQAVAEAINATEDKPDYEFPPLSLLRSGGVSTVDSREEIITNKERLEGAIRSFGISATIVGRDARPDGHALRYRA